MVNYQAPPAIDIAPWGWNPAATFQKAYNDAQEEKRAQQEFEVGMELERFLLPMKKQQAQLALEKMNLQMERTRGEIDRQRILTRQMTDATRNTNRGSIAGFRGVRLLGHKDIKANSGLDVDCVSRPKHLQQRRLGRS